MKKLGTLALTLTLTGAMALPALAAEEPELVIAPADTGYGQTIVLNGETLDHRHPRRLRGGAAPPAPAGRGRPRLRLLG
ncbi:MAG: hypothetical protein V8S11_08700 [Flavonifractor plautii]